MSSNSHKLHSETLCA